MRQGKRTCLRCGKEFRLIDPSTVTGKDMQAWIDSQLKLTPWWWCRKCLEAKGSIWRK